VARVLLTGRAMRNAPLLTLFFVAGAAVTGGGAASSLGGCTGDLRATSGDSGAPARDARSLAEDTSARDAITPDASISLDGSSSPDVSMSVGPTPDSGPPTPAHLCGATRPAGAPTPAPLATYSGGACPMLVAGNNTLASSGSMRSFLVVAPSSPRAGERLPVSFLWHPLGSDADVFLSGGVLQRAADTERFVAVLPQAKGDLPLRWPSTGGGARVDEELRFFDDMLACVAASWTIETDCVSTGGVSAGALWVARLANARADRLASFVSVSGGSGGAFPSWGTVSHRLPAMVLWGGPSDTCGPFSFDSGSQALGGSLARDGHAVIECVHNCGHAMPPFESGDPFLPILHFGLNHPFWLGAGESPYETTLPPIFPGWCALGAGAATQRTGACTAPSAC